MKKILVTGATGYLGSNLVHHLITDYEVVVLKRKKSNTARIDSLLPRIKTLNLEDACFADIFQGQNFSGVIHCATNYGRDENDLDDTIEANLILPLRLLKNAIENKVQFFINTDTILDKRISYYTLSKGHFRDWLQFFSHQIQCVNVELEHFYGKGDDPTKFVSKMVTELSQNQDKELALTLGEQKRSFIYIDDVVHAFKLILDKIPQLKEGFTTFQVGSKTQISIKDFVVLTKELCGNTNTRLNFGALPYRKNEDMNVHVDLRPLEALGWSEKTTLRQGLEQAIAFERERLKNL